MKKIYFSLVLILLVVAYTYGKNVPIAYSDISNYISKDLNLPNLRSANETISPDSTITYNADGTYLSKRVTKYPGLFDGYQIYDVNLYTWNTDLNNWEQINRLVSANNKNGERILQETYKWDNTIQNWIIDNSRPGYNYQIKNTYNSLNLLTYSERKLWNSDLSNWIEDDRIELSYDSIGRTSNATIYQWGDLNGDGKIEWERYQERNYLYEVNNMGKPTKSSVYYYSADTILIRATRSEFTYDTIGNVIAKENWEYTQNDSIWKGTVKYLYSYNSKKAITQQEAYSWNSQDYEWMPLSKSKYEYDNSQTIQVSSQLYQWDFNGQVWLGTSGQELIYNQSGVAYGNISYFWNTETNVWDRRFKSITKESITKDYSWNGTEWLLDSYSIHFPIKEEETKIEVEETQPISEDNKGKFELTLTLPTEATVTGSFILEFPEGISLDKENTMLTPELANQFDLSFTALENNKWRIEIVKKQSGFRSALSEIAYKKILDVAYVVSENIASGNKTIEVKELSLEKSTGGTIQQESIQVNIGIKNGLNIEDDIQDQLGVYAFGNELIIQSKDATQVVIYSASGVATSTFTKESQNDLRIDISNLSAGVYVIKSSSGSVTKFLKR